MPWWRPARSTLQPGDCGSLELIDNGRLAIHQPHRIGTVDALIALLSSIWRTVPLVQRRGAAPGDERSC
jgi:hypothetical protein